MLDRARLGLDLSVEQVELKGFSRSIGEIEWLLLALVLLHFQVADIAEAVRPHLLVAMIVYTLFVSAWRYFYVSRDETRWKLTVEVFVMIAFVSYVLWLTGRTESPLLNLYVLVIITAAITLGKLETILIVGLITGCYVWMAWTASGTGLFTFATYSQLLARFTPFLLIAYLTTVLASDLQATKALYRELSETDELTGLLNARAFNERLAEEIRRSERYHEPFSIVMIDSDSLKSVNDGLGHEAGNLLLKAMAKSAGSSLRRTDTLARFGGDEFVALLPKTSLASALTIAERVRESIASARIDVRGRLASATASLGVATWPDDAVEARDLIDKADAALYHSKREGRNRVSSYARGSPQSTDADEERREGGRIA